MKKFTELIILNTPLVKILVLNVLTTDQNRY